MKQLAWLIGLTMFAAAASSLCVHVVHSQLLGRAAFTAAVTETMFRDEGQEPVTVRATFAVRPDGSNVRYRRFVAPDGRAVEHKAIMDLSARKRVFVDGLTDSLTTTSVSADHAAEVSAKPGRCTTEENPEGGKLLGFDVVKLERMLPRRQMQRREESWLAPALDCYPLKQALYVQAGAGPEVLTNLREVTEVVLGEPDPQLFAVPSRYIERSPSEVLAEHKRRYGDRGQFRGKGAQRMDEAYFGQQGVR